MGLCKENHILFFKPEFKRLGANRLVTEIATKD